MRKKFHMRKTTPTHPGVPISSLNHPIAPVPEVSQSSSGEYEAMSMCCLCVCVCVRVCRTH